MIRVEPTADKPVPFDTAPEEAKTFHDEVSLAANTADILSQLGATIEIGTEDIDKTVELLKSRKKTTTELRKPETAFAASLFLKTYANRVSADMQEIRSAITAKLMEIANCGDPRYELKALELLGKHSDVGLFTERSEITITHKNSDDLEAAIKERIKRLLNSDVIDVTPIADNLDAELGVVDPPANAAELLTMLEPEQSEETEAEEGDDEQRT